MSGAPTWGVCATVKATTTETLRFAAHHLDAGAHRVWIYLDEDDAEARAALKAHPKCRAIVCDEAYWKRTEGKRPLKHQVRQSLNATRALKRATNVDWLLHIDVDEFIVSDQPVATSLARVPEATLTARVRPMEALASKEGASPTAFKKFIPPGPDRTKIVSRLYPQYATYLKGGFLSHVAGKIFTRTGQPDVNLRIHNALRDKELNTDEVDLDDLKLAHVHATDWTAWRTRFAYRHEKGAYRAELAPVRPAAQGGVTLHAYFESLLENEGEEGLRSFFDTVCADSDELRSRLAAEDLLERHDLELDAKLHQHFPQFTVGPASV